MARRQTGSCTDKVQENAFIASSAALIHLISIVLPPQNSPGALQAPPQGSNQPFITSSGVLLLLCLYYFTMASKIFIVVALALVAAPLVGEH